MKTALRKTVSCFVAAVAGMAIAIPMVTVRIAPDKASVSAQVETVKKTEKKKEKKNKAGWGHESMASSRKEGLKKK